MPGRDLELPPSDADRARAIESLRRAAPQLGLDELERRMDLALAAQTVGELAMIAWDLPAADSDAAAYQAVQRRHVSAWRSAWFRSHAAAYGLTNGMLIGVWGLTGEGLFWPFFPIAGWGIGLGMHAVTVRNEQRKRQERDERKLQKAARAELPRPARQRRALSAPAVPTQAVVMFIDIVDSTRLTAVIGDEDWTRVRARHRELLHRCYESYRGTEVNTVGDGFLARFDGAPEAVQCAVDIQLRLQDDRRELGFSPSVRIGINAGQAMDEGGDLLGMVVNIAARLTALADAGEILTTEAVADRLDTRFHLDDLGLRELKGVERSVHVLAVRWAG